MEFSESKSAAYYVPSLGMKRKKYKERETPGSAIVIHTTGIGPVLRATHKDFAAWREKNGLQYGDVMGAAVLIYRSIMDASGHYVCWNDSAVQLVPERFAAWHVGGKGSDVYLKKADGTWGGSKPEAGAYGWWFKKWAGLRSPIELAGGHLWGPYTKPGLGTRILNPGAFAALSCNSHTYGIEVPPPVHSATGEWSDRTWRGVTELVLDIAERNGIVPRPDTVVTHSDAHPISRTKNGAPWDPHPNQFTFERFKKEAAAIGVVL